MDICRKCFLCAAAMLMLLCSVGCKVGKSVGRSIGRDVKYKVSSVVGNYGFPRKLNVILIVSHDQGYGDMACHGNDVVNTLNIDRFYKQSSRFEKFFVSPLGPHTQVSLLSGRNIPVSGNLLDDDVSLAEVLSNAGYKTCIAGKWRLPWNYSHSPSGAGFQKVFCQRLKEIPTEDNNLLFEGMGVYSTDEIFDLTIGFIEENRDGPFFCYVSVNVADKSDEVDEKYSTPYTEQGLSEEVANFYGSITNLDDNLGRLVKRTRQLGLLENTLIIFMTGTGSAMADSEGLFNAGFRGGKGSVHEGGSRAASFWRMPGTIKAGRTVGQMAMHYDIAPSLVSICDGEHPNAERLEGINLIPYLKNFKQKEKDRTFVILDDKGKCAVRTSKFRLVNGIELYDINANSSETINVIKKYPAEVAQLKAACRR